MKASLAASIKREQYQKILLSTVTALKNEKKIYLANKLIAAMAKLHFLCRLDREDLRQRGPDVGDRGVHLHIVSKYICTRRKSRNHIFLVNTSIRSCNRAGFAGVDPPPVL